MTCVTLEIDNQMVNLNVRSFTSWMEFLDNLPQIVSIEVSIDFCCRDGLVSKHILNSPEIRATFYQMRCKRMPEGVRAHPFVQANLRDEVFNNRKHHHPGELPPIPVKENK